MKICYVHNVIMPYKLPMLRALGRIQGVEVCALGGRSHWPQSKFHRALRGYPDPKVKSLPTLDLYVPHRGRALHAFFSPTLARALSAEAPDLVVAGVGNVLNNPALKRWCDRRGVPYIWHGIGSMYRTKSVLRKLFDPMLRHFLDGALGGWAFNTQSKSYYTDEYGLDGARVHVIPNILDDETIKESRAGLLASTDRRQARSDSLSVLFVGHLAPTKKVETLIDAIALVRDRGVAASLTVVGDGPSRVGLEDHADRRGLRDVNFAGAQYDGVDHYFLGADVFVLPGLGGLAIHHALCHQLPVICSAGDGSGQDMVKHGKSGYLLDSGDAEEIAEYLVKLAADPELLKTMSAAASLQVQEQFSIEAVAEVMRHSLTSFGLLVS